MGAADGWKEWTPKDGKSEDNDWPANEGWSAGAIGSVAGAGAHASIWQERESEEEDESEEKEEVEEVEEEKDSEEEKEDSEEEKEDGVMDLKIKKVTVMGDEEGAHPVPRMAKLIRVARKAMKKDQ